MKVLWDVGDLTVRGVRERLYARRPLAYTTVMTVLDRLARKGAVSRRKVGRAHLYHTVYSRSAALDRALRRLLENYFGGSRDLLLSHLAPVVSPQPAPIKPVPETPASGLRAPSPRPQETLDEALL